MVQSGDGKRWTWLYDIHEAQPKKSRRSPEEGLEILADRMARKERREWEKAHWEALDYRSRDLLFSLNQISHWLETPERFPFGNEEYWRRAKQSSIRHKARNIRKYARECKEALHKLYPPRKPQPGDAVLGGTQKQPQPYDAVLGKK